MRTLFVTAAALVGACTLSTGLRAAEPPAVESDTSIVVTVDDPDATEPAESVGMSAAAPNLGVQIFGPRRLMIGKQALYTVKLNNPARTSINEVLVSVAAPDWVEVADIWASSGFTAEAPAGPGYLWRFPIVDPGADHELRLLIIPRKSEALKLDVTWTCAPPIVQSAIEVDEAILRIGINGPKEVISGRPQLYTIDLENTGNGDADDVLVNVVARDGQRLLASERIDMLKAGAKRTLELMLTIRELGVTSIRAEARSGEAVARVETDIAVHRPQLELTVSAPRNQYAGSTATAEITVENPGDAPAHDIDLVITLPESAAIVSASHGVGQGEALNEIRCRIDEVPAAGIESISLKYRIAAPGEFAIAARAVAKDNLTSAATAPVQVVPTPNLAIEVVGMPGPIPVGTPTTYLIEINNRGTCVTEALEVFVSLTDGLKPVLDDPWRNVAPGKVALQPEPLKPGASATYRLTAQPTKAGNHRIRVEAHDRPLGVRLMQEVGTLFYSDADLAPQ